MSQRPVNSKIEKGMMLWVRHEQLVYILAKVLGVDEFNATVRTEGENKIIQIDLINNFPFLANPTSSQEDMCSLHYIHEASILQNLQERSLKSLPYTLMSSILVAVNPLRQIPNPPVGSSAVISGPPHPYLIAETAYRQMIFQGCRELLEKKGGNIKLANQSIVIGGESGSGKTESSKMVLAHIVARSSSKQSSSSGEASSSLDVKLLGTNPILEAFGNAATLRNPNSSRFGKMMRLYFEGDAKNNQQWKLLGATVQSYLLERSRVTSHEIGERSYHVFYQMCAATSASKELLDLRLEKGASSFKYCTPITDAQIEANRKDDESNFNKMVAAMEAIGIKSFYRRGVFEILASLLHVGNLEFRDTETGSAIVNSELRDFCAQLLGVSSIGLENIFCERRFTTGTGEKVVSFRNAKAAGFARDAAVKSIYANMFDWIIKKIEEALLEKDALSKPDNKGKICQLGVLDIFGFEAFQINGFEQLMINFANESLQGTFNAQIFVAEAALYQKEGLFGTDDYINRPTDNSLTVDLLQGDLNKKDVGLLLTIDSEGRSPDANDGKLIQRIHALFGANPCMIRPHPKDASRTFIIRHYAGPVVYTAGSFLEKNNDRLPDEMDSFFLSSTKASTRELFESVAPGDSGANRKPPSRSIIHKFTSQMKTLITDLEETKCCFIRCIKPNPSMFRDDKNGDWFDRRYVTKQLHSLNIPQTAEVLRNGFPSRIDYSNLVNQYATILPQEALGKNQNRLADPKSFVRALFWAFRIDANTFKLGLTKVFFKAGQLAELDSIMKADKESLNMKEIASRFKLYFARVKWRRAAIGAIAMSRFVKLYEKSRKKIASAVLIQTFVRAALKKRQFRKLRRGALMTQKHWRGKIGRRLAQKKRIEQIEKARKMAEEARKRKDAEAAERAFQMEQEAKLAQERIKREQEEANRSIDAALLKQREEGTVNEVEVERRKSKSAVTLSLRRSTRVGFVEEETRDSVRLKSGGVLKTNPMHRRAMSLTGEGSKVRIAGDEDGAGSVGRRGSKKSFAARRVSTLMVESARRRVSRLTGGTVEKKKPALEGKSALEKLATVSRQEFGIKVMGFCLYQMKNAQAPSSGGFFSKLFSGGKTSSGKYTWKRVFFVLDKPVRSLVLYQDERRRVVVKEFVLKATTKVYSIPDEGGKDCLVEIRDHVFGNVRLSHEGVKVKERWVRDVNESIIGFDSLNVGRRKQNDDLESLDDEERLDEMAQMYGAQMREEKVNQLRLLLKQGQITQDEFDDACEAIATSIDPAVNLDGNLADEEDNGAYDVLDDDFGAQVACNKCGWSNNTMFGRYTCVKCGQALPKPEGGLGKDESEWNPENGVVASAGKEEKDLLLREDGAVLGYKPTPLKNACAKNLYYLDGRVSMEMLGATKHMDLFSFSETVLYGLDIRFRDEEDSNLEIGWVVSHQLKTYVALYEVLIGNDSPLTLVARKKVPPLSVSESSNEAEVTNVLNKWLESLFKSAHSGKPVKDKKESMMEDEDEDEQAGNAASSGAQNNNNKDTPAHLLPSSWRSVRDPASGDVYYYNIISGVVQWNNPFEGDEQVEIQESLPLKANWEAVLDKSSGDYYYWNTITNETTWDRPTDTNRKKTKKKKKLYELKDLLKTSALDKFLDLKRNVERINEQLAL